MDRMNEGVCSRGGGVPDQGAGLVAPDAGPCDTAFHQSYPAVATSAGAIRTCVSQFARSVGVSAARIDNVELAVSEAATNVVVHAYRDRNVPGTIDVTATVAADELWVIITDTGLGFRPRADTPGLGLGLAIIAQLADGLDLVRPSAGGLELRMRFALAKQANG
jgi:serine/threonine-protein kinase RsbW